MDLDVEWNLTNDSDINSFYWYNDFYPWVVTINQKIVSERKENNTMFTISKFSPMINNVTWYVKDKVQSNILNTSKN